MKLRTPGKFGHIFANSGNPDETAPYRFAMLKNKHFFQLVYAFREVFGF